MIEAWYLPEVAEPAPGHEREWHSGRTLAGAPLRAPRLTADRASRVAESVRSAALQARQQRTLAEVIRVVAGAARRLADAGDPCGREARGLLGDELGWSEALIGETLEGMAALWTSEQLESLARSELGDLKIMDEFRRDDSRAGRYRRACGPSLLFVTLSGNVPGVAVTAAIRGLLVRSGVLCKLPEDEPALLVAFARALGEEDELLGRCLAASWWPGSSEDPCWSEWMTRAGKVVVYGGAEAVAGVRSRARADAEVILYGPRLGVGVVLSDASGAAVGALARDVCAYEQQGCVSPRVVYVVQRSAEEFGGRLAASLGAEVDRLGATPPPASDASAIRAARAEWEFGGYGPGRSMQVFGANDDLRWTVLASERPGAETTSLPRLVYVHRVDVVSGVEEALAPLAGRIQVVGYAGRAGLEELAEAAVRLGASRVAPLGSAAWPPADWRHEGRHQLLPLLNWTDLELPG